MKFKVFLDGLGQFIEIHGRYTEKVSCEDALNCIDADYGYYAYDAEQSGDPEMSAYHKEYSEAETRFHNACESFFSMAEEVVGTGDRIFLEAFGELDYTSLFLKQACIVLGMNLPEEKVTAEDIKKLSCLSGEYARADIISAHIPFKEEDIGDIFDVLSEEQRFERTPLPEVMDVVRSIYCTHR